MMRLTRTTGSSNSNAMDLDHPCDARSKEYVDDLLRS